MKIQQILLIENNWSEKIESIHIDANLFLLFFSPDFNLKDEVLGLLNKKYPKSTIIGCSTGGEISDVTLNHKTISLTAIQLEKPNINRFYSYGEIAPFEEFSHCELHNQTMTKTTLSEC